MKPRRAAISVMPRSARVTIFVKALPQPSKRYGETVCYAGVTAGGTWKRLFPIRFRHLKGESSFDRWDWVKFAYRSPTTDRRAESCHVYEESIVIDGKLPPKEKAHLLNPLIVGSAKDAMELGHSLGLIRPRKTRFLADHDCADHDCVTPTGLIPDPVVALERCPRWSARTTFECAFAPSTPGVSERAACRTLTPSLWIIRTFGIIREISV